MSILSAYKRFVSYLYEYDHRKKRKNRGFVRVEVRNHQCRLELYMTLPACPFIPVFRAYAFVARPGGTLHGLFLGNPSWKQGNVYGQFQISDTGICNSSWNLDDIDGLIVVCDTGQRYATCWSDCKISPEDLLLSESAPILRAASLEQPEPVKPDAAVTHFDPVPAPDSSRSSNTAPARAQAPVFSWKRLTESYPQVTPFFDEEIHTCLQLSPKDLSLLGSFGVSCGNNQFFLYGSHAFQHFLLGKMEHEDTICYILAVPGIYEERERLLANLFGFPYFKSARAKDAQPGHFGYWYRTIHTEPRNPDPISPGSPPAESFSGESAESSPAVHENRT